jgi:hypothetical protein
MHIGKHHQCKLTLRSAVFWFLFKSVHSVEGKRARDASRKLLLYFSLHITRSNSTCVSFHFNPNSTHSNRPTLRSHLTHSSTIHAVFRFLSKKCAALPIFRPSQKVITGTPKTTTPQMFHWLEVSYFFDPHQNVITLTPTTTKPEMLHWLDVTFSPLKKCHCPDTHDDKSSSAPLARV